MSDGGTMYIPKNLNLDNGIPMTSNPMLFGMKTAENLEENFEMFEGDQAQFLKAAANPTSGIRIVDTDTWESKGFFIKEHKNQRVVVKIFDITGIKLEKEKEKKQSIEKSKVETIGDVQEQLKLMMLKINNLEKEGEQNNEAHKAEMLKMEKEKNEALKKYGHKNIGENIEDKEGVDTQAMTISIEKQRKPAPKKRVKTAKKDAK